ncbi:hypothetical protein BKA70DRAFT_1301370 [Coprinopsis sp. MPI-PUGE-AT-0042]|nr:hypothetical protein BKA70DRAFT_1301370 [Coprinopsis sp. MPI-PUGE-AT-0042]
MTISKALVLIPCNAWIALYRHSHAFCPYSSRTVAVEQPIRKRHCPCYEEHVICFDHLQLDSPCSLGATLLHPTKHSPSLFSQPRSACRSRFAY